MNKEDKIQVLGCYDPVVPRIESIPEVVERYLRKVDYLREQDRQDRQDISQKIWRILFPSGLKDVYNLTEEHIELILSDGEQESIGDAIDTLASIIEKALTTKRVK